MHDIGIRCGHLLSMKEGSADPQADQFIGIRGGKIAEVAPWTHAQRSSCKEFIDGSGHAVMPGLINGHTHLAMSLFRGLSDDAPFQQWLFEKILPLEARLVDSDFVRIGTRLAALECIRFGVTTVNDMYFFAETAADVLDEAGLRALVGQVWSSGELPEDRVLGQDKSALFGRLREKYASHERIVPVLAPHAPYTCGDGIFREVARLSEKHGAPIHTHLSETEGEVRRSLQEHGKSPVKRLSELGVLGARTIAAHCVHLDDEDTEILRSSGASVAYNPDSNMKLGSGVAPIARYRSRGIRVCFGTDGAASNNDLSIFGAMDVGTKLQKLSASDSTAMVAADALRCATWEAAGALGLSAKTGSVETGKDADIILVNLGYPHLQPLHDLKSLLVYSAQGLEVDTVLCQGRVLMRKGEILSLDRERIFAEAGKMCEKIRAAT